MSNAQNSWIPGQIPRSHTEVCYITLQEDNFRKVISATPYLWRDDSRVIAWKPIEKPEPYNPPDPQEEIARLKQEVQKLKEALAQKVTVKYPTQRDARVKARCICGIYPDRLSHNGRLLNIDTESGNAYKYQIEFDDERILWYPYCLILENGDETK